MNKFKNAFNGIVVSIKYDSSIRLMFLLSILTSIFSIIFPFPLWQKIIITILVFLVVCLEILNSIIENLCNYLQVEYDLSIKKIKDMSAGCVLLMSIGSFLIFVFFILNYFLGG